MADTTPENETKISIKVFVDKVKKKVVYAEADYSFVNILFSFMTLPMATIIKLLKKLDDHNKFEVLGSLNNLYKSLKDLPECYISAEECRFMILNPISLSHDYFRYLKLELLHTEPMEYFLCSKCGHRSCSYSLFVSTNYCIKCRRSIGKSYFFGSGVGSNGFVSDSETFIVTDDWFVMPYTAAASFKLLTDQGINDTSLLEERKLHLGREQVLYLLKMALLVDSPFTHFVFQINLDLLGHGTTFDQFDFIKQETSTTSKMLLEVYLQKSNGNLLFAEAKEDFVDFLFGFLPIPLGTIVGTLLNSSSITCMDNLYKSILDMNVGRYLKSQEIKDMLVKPHFGEPYFSKNHMCLSQGTVVKLKCSDHEVKDPRINERCLEQSGTFFVTDDLRISPSSSSLAMETLSKLKISLDEVERHEISIGLKEGLRILKASLRSEGKTLSSSSVID